MAETVSQGAVKPWAAVSAALKEAHSSVLSGRELSMVNIAVATRVRMLNAPIGGVRGAEHGAVAGTADVVTVPTEWTEAEARDVLRACRVASAVYMNEFQFSAHTGLGLSDVVAAQWKTSLLRPAWALVRDHAACTIWLAIRGTSSMSDALTDAAAAAVLWKFARLEEPVAAHGGMLRAALWVVDCVADKLQEERSGQCEGYKLRVVGHSLGGGTAALLTMLLLDLEVSNLTATTFAPAAVVAAEAAAAYAPEITGFTLENDIVPRLSCFSAAAIASALHEEGHRVAAATKAQIAAHPSVAAASAKASAAHAAVSGAFKHAGAAWTAKSYTSPTVAKINQIGGSIVTGLREPMKSKGNRHAAAAGMLVASMAGAGVVMAGAAAAGAMTVAATKPWKRWGKGKDKSTEQESAGTDSEVRSADSKVASEASPARSTSGKPGAKADTAAAAAAAADASASDAESDTEETAAVPELGPHMRLPWAPLQQLWPAGDMYMLRGVHALEDESASPAVAAAAAEAQADADVQDVEAEHDSAEAAVSAADYESYVVCRVPHHAYSSVVLNRRMLVDHLMQTIDGALVQVLHAGGRGSKHK